MTHIDNPSFPYDDVFCLPYDGRYIVYLPLKDIIFVANARLVNLLYQAGCKSKEAMKELGIDESLVNALLDSHHRAEQLGRRKPPSKFAPTSISLFLTNDCTLRCNYCYARGGDGQGSMPWELFTGLAEQLLTNAQVLNNKHITVNFHGGGDVSAAWPLMVRAREYLGQMARDNGLTLRTSVGLNGMLNTDQRQWVIANIDSATVSLDGPPDIQDLQRPRVGGQASFTLVSETIKAFDAAGFQYGIRSTITAGSVNRMEEIAAFFCAEYKTHSVKFEPVCSRGRAADDGLKGPDAMDFVEGFRKARKVMLQHGRDLLYSGARLETVTSVFCQAAGESCAVTPEGWVTSCYEILSPEDPLSSIFFYGRYDIQQRRFIIDSRRRKRLFSLSVLKKPYCAKCFCKWHCAGDCPAKSPYPAGASHLLQPARCTITRELTMDQIVEAIHLTDADSTE